MIRGFLLGSVLVLGLLSLPAMAAEEIVDYGQCVALVQRNPALAEQSARVWENRGGGPAAGHCTALALTALGRYSEAARKLDSLAREKGVGNNLNRADLFDQAGNAWMLAGSASNAVQSFSAALSENANDTGVMADRARARAMLKDWSGADADLSAALMHDQNRADLLVLRADARWTMGHKAAAATDILRALQLYPDYPPALVERGQMKYSAGDKAGARKDWQKAADSGQGQAAADAKRNLAALNAEPKPVH